MTNDKRIILAIALYAAVIIMVLHTLDSEGHERVTIINNPVEHCIKHDSVTPMAPTNQTCTEASCTDLEIAGSNSDVNTSKEEESVLLLTEQVNG